MTELQFWDELVLLGAIFSVAAFKRLTKAAKKEDMTSALHNRDVARPAKLEEKYLISIDVGPHHISREIPQFLFLVFSIIFSPEVE